MMKIHNFSGHIGKTFNILSELNLSSPQIFKKISFQFAEANPQKRILSVNNAEVKVPLEQILELENIEIFQLSLSQEINTDVTLIITYIIE